MTYEDIRNSIKKHEGYREEPYHCTEGHLTGGYGHKIIDGEDIPVPPRPKGPVLSEITHILFPSL